MKWEALAELDGWDGPVEDLPDASAFLTSAGFRPLGWIGAEGSPGGVFAGPDAHLDRFVHRAAASVWLDGPGTTLAMPSTWVDGTWIRFTSRLGDGTIVDTRRRPARPPVTTTSEERGAMARRSPLHAALVGWIHDDPETLPARQPTDLDLCLVDSADDAVVLEHHRGRLVDPEPVPDLAAALALHRERFVRGASELWAERDLARGLALSVVSVGVVSVVVVGAWGASGFGVLGLLAGLGLGSVGLWAWPAVSLALAEAASRVVRRRLAGLARRPPRLSARCPYCHEPVSSSRLVAHVFLHEGAGEVQTLPPERRFQGSIEGEPTVYEHLHCGGLTGVDEEIVRTWMADATFYGDRTFCTGCGTLVPEASCVWVDTRENLKAYKERLVRAQRT